MSSNDHIHTHATFLWPSWILSGTTRVSRHQKGKTDLDLLEQERVNGSGISWAIFTLTRYCAAKLYVVRHWQFDRAYLSSKCFGSSTVDDFVAISATFAALLISGFDFQL